MKLFTTSATRVAGYEENSVKRTQKPMSLEAYCDSDEQKGNEKGETNKRPLSRHVHTTDVSLPIVWTAEA